MRIGRWLLAASVVGAVLVPAAPASAWGSYGHGLIAARAYDQLVPQHPWLAAQREAFMWGALAPDVGGCASASLAHSAGTLGSLWREAEASGDAGARAFVMGWAVHLAADEVEHAGASERRAAFREALAATDAPPPPEAIEPLVDWALDRALVPVGNGTLTHIFYAAVSNVGSPAAAPLREMLKRVLGVDEPAYVGYARHQALSSAGSIDRYFESQARSLQIGPWEGALREAQVRLALGNLTPLVSRSVNQGIKRAERLLEAAGSAPPPVSSKGQLTP